MASIALVQVEGQIAAQLLESGQLGRESLEEFDRPAQVLESLRRRPAEMELVVVGARAPEPIRLAQRIQALDKLLAVTIIGTPGDHDTLRNEIRFAPFLNGAVRCETVAPDHAPDQLVAPLLDAATGTRQRRRHLAQVAASRQRLTTQAPPQPRRATYLEHFFAYAPIGMVALDSEGLIIASNHAADALLAPSRESLLQSRLCEFFPPKEVAGLKKLIRESAIVPPSPAPARFQLHQEPEQFLQITASALQGSPGDSSPAPESGTVVLLQDVTAMVQAEREAKRLAAQAAVAEAVRDSEARYQELFDFAPVGYHQLDTEGRIARVNRTELQILGYETNEMLGRPIWEFAEDPDQVREAVEEKLRGRRPPSSNLERIYRRKDGSTVPVLIEDRLQFDDAGAVSGILTTIQDITLLKQTRRELEEHARALEQSNKELEQFAYIASHDLQEPLRMVDSYVRLLAERYKGKLDPEAGEFIDFAVDGAQRMQQLIKDLLTYSRVGTRGKTPAPVNTEKTIEAVLQNLKIAIEESGAQITHDPLPVVNADPTQLIQVFQNLLENAIKFCGEAPPVIRISAERQDGQWLFSFKDNGMGIDPTQARRVFLIFQRLHSHVTYPGTGIGLALCQKIIERFGGQISVESEPGKGATFRFTLPAVEEKIAEVS